MAAKQIKIIGTERTVWVESKKADRLVKARRAEYVGKSKTTKRPR